MNAIPLLFFLKAHVKAHDRRLPSGKVVRVKAHEDGRTQKHRLTHPGRLFDWFSRLGNQAGTPEQGIRDAHSLLNLPGIIAFRRSDELGYETPAAVDTKSGELLVNPDFKLTRAQWAQVMAEEIMHVVDLVSPGRSLSVASKRLDQHDGDIAKEAILAHAGDKGLADFLAYPLSASGLSWQTKRAELFARLAVLYHGDPSQMQRQLPIAYEAYHVLFGTTLLGPDSRVLRDVRSKRTAGGAEKRGRKRISANPNGGFGYRDSGDAAHQGLVALRGAIAQVFDANPAGRSILASLLNAAPNIIQEPLTDAQFRRQLDLFLDLEPADAGQPGPKTEAAKQSAVAAVTSLRGATGSVLGPRLADTYAARQRVSLVGRTLTSREDLATLAQVYRDPRFETFRLFFVNDAGKIVSQVGLSSRLPASSAVFVGPDNQQYLDDLARSARMAGATGYYMLHNHPSTNPNPSDADIRLTKKFAKDLPMVNFGHVILDTNEFCAIGADGTSRVIQRDFGQVSPYATHEFSGAQILSPESLIEVVKRIDVDKDAVTLVVTDASHKVLGVTSVPAGELLKAKHSTRTLRIRRALKAMNGSKVFAVGANMQILAGLSDMVVDAIHVGEPGNYQSLAMSMAYGHGDPFNVKSRQVPRITPDTSPEFDYLRDKTMAERKRVLGKSMPDADDLLKTFPGHSGRPGLVGGSAKRAPAREGGEEIGAVLDESVHAANRQVNKLLRQWAEGRLPSSAIMDLGRPSSLLRQFDIPDKPIHLTQRVLRKATDKKHKLSPDLLVDIALHIHAPLAVFGSKTNPDGRVILTEITHETGNVVVAIDVDVERDGIEIHNIASIHPKSDHKVMYWLEEGKLLGYAKDNGREWLENSAGSNSQQPQVIAAIDGAIVYDRSHLVKAKDLRKSIVLEFASGAVFWLFQSQYRWQVSNLLLKALGPGERWITVHSGGNKDAKGVPVLVRESQTGSGVYHVIGGAGGKLNYLKLRGLKPESDYKAQARERAANKRQAKKEQAKREREAGTAGVKNAQRAAVSQQQRQQEAQFVEQVAKVMGWDDKTVRFDPEAHTGLSEPAMKKAADRHHREVLQRALEAVDVQRERLIADPDLRAAAGLDKLPAHADLASQLSVDDIDPVTPTGHTLGFAPKYEQRAEAAGASPDVIKQEAEAVKDERLTPEQREAAIKRGETRAAVKKELENIRQPAKEDLKIELADARQAVELLKMKKQLRAVQQKAQAARAEIDKDQSGKVKAYNLTVGDEPDLDDKVKADLENDLRTAQTRTFLSTVRETGGKDYEQTLNGAIGAGAYNSINALAITAGGAALVDRSVVDVLGPAGAAQVLARRLHADLDAETVDKLVTDFEDFHVNEYMATSKAAIEQATDLQAKAKALQIDEASDADDLAIAKSVTEQRMKAIAESQRLLGTALGEMETNAALVAALKAGRTDTPLEVPLGGLSPEDAIKQARAIGLQRGDYRLDKVDGNEILTVSPEGLDRLAKPVDVAEMQRARRNLDIIEGRADEENWLPKGVANRPDLAMPPVNPGVADVLAKPFEPGDDLEQSLKDYIGGRMADGDAPADILSDIQSQTFFDKAGMDRFNEYMTALDHVAPLKDDKGKSRPVETLRPAFEAMADEFVDRHYGGERSPLHRQTFDPNDEAAAESLYRSLAEVPEGIAAYKPIGELSNQDQRALREFFHANVAKEDAEAAGLRQDLEDLTANEPDKEFEDMFGETAENPEWRAWKNKRDNLAEQANRAKLSWDKYVTLQRGQANAYAAMQDLIKSRVTEKFIDHYNRAHTDKPMKVGRTVIRNHLAHADAIDPALRESRLEEQRQLNAKLQARNAGKFANDDVIGKQQSAREADEAMRQAQFSLFGDEELPEAQSTPLRADERHTLGHAAENQISRMVPMMARNFKPGQPFQMWQPSMNGKGIARQRAIKLIESNKHQILALGTGAGKTLVQMGAFAHLQQTGQAKRGLFLVPSIVQSEFRGEAARYLDPKANNGQGFNYHIEPGASREERIAAYKDPKHHFAVMTHSAFRDDMLHLGAQQAGITKDAMSVQMSDMSPDEQATWLKGVMDKKGINFDYVSLDEAQVALNREGKKDSALAGIVGGLSRNSPYFVMASADPVKNDMSEVHSALNYMDPKRYGDRAEFMRRYGSDTPGSQAALKSELANYVYAHKIDPEGVKAIKQTVSVDLNDDQQRAITDLQKHLASARMARMSGKVDVQAVKALMPERFEGIPDGEHEAVAKELQRNLGLAKEAAMGRLIDDTGISAKYQKAIELANERKGKPGIIFAHRIESVHELAKKLEAEGHPVTVLTGKDSPDEKARKVREYKAKGGILVASDAASTGMNAQNAQWVVQYDTPQTALTHAQRGARAYRTGQKNDVEQIDLVANHDHERRARDRLAKKYELRDLMTSPLEAGDDSGLAYYLRKRDSQQQGVF